MARPFASSILLCAALCVRAGSVRAAESYDNCTGFIDALPATVSASGTWCLRHDLATNITGGPAINIATDDVAIDCNGFKIGGLAAGDDSDAIGIEAVPPQYAYRRNIAVRHCNIRGFSTGIYLPYGIGHLVEDNRLDNNLSEGIIVRSGYGNRILRNAVYDTGGHKQRGTRGMDATGIEGYGEISGNIVDGFLTNGDSGDVYGIIANGAAPEVKGNRVGGLINMGGTGRTYGITLGVYGQAATMAGNRISAPSTIASGSGSGIHGGFCSSNTIANFAIAMDGCTDDGGNASY